MEAREGANKVCNLIIEIDIFDPQCDFRFDLFIPLHRLWLGYMSELLGLAPPPSAPNPNPAMPSAASMHAKLVKADFHGSLITVKQSKNVCIVGLSGIVIHETENAFKVITSKDKLKRSLILVFLFNIATDPFYHQTVLPKQNSIFSFAVPLYSTLPPSASASSSCTATLAGSDLAETAKATVLDQPHIEFELYGNQFRFRSAERAGRKFKPKETIEL